MAHFSQSYTDFKWLNTSNPYIVQSGYKWLRQGLPKVAWRFLCWNPLNIPKTSFIFWALMLQRLLTKDRLTRMGIVVDVQCEICRIMPEDHQHLFYSCDYSTECSRLLQQLLQIHFQVAELIQCYSKAKVSKLQRRFPRACYVSLFYHIWKMKAHLKMFVKKLELIIQQVIKDVKTRFQRMNKCILKAKDSLWLQKF
ncbi:uncharacterized protein LOC141595063 [Silene latifolia]|uniref:uncharacterized protein LOC141595063 n=1 Tax=Silene latifolia TaxID=37657 RepID=UPI003D782540